MLSIYVNTDADLMTRSFKGFYARVIMPFLTQFPKTSDYSVRIAN